MVRAVVVAITMTLGFITVFGLVGILSATFLSTGTIAERAPWITLGFGIVMVPVGVAMLFGFEPKVNIRRVQAGGKTATLPSIFLFGVSYATVSISCTIGLFLLAVVDSFGDEGVLDGAASLVAYAVGMGLVIMVLTLSLALARTSVATNMRRFLPYVNRVSGAMLACAGAYLAVYGIWEVQVDRGDEPWGWVDAIVARGQAAESFVRTWITDTGPNRLAVGLTVIVGGAITWAASAQLTRRADRTTVRAMFVAVWLAVEIAVYQLDLLVLPALRSIADLPERVVHWFTDPGRWSVLFEVLLLGFVTAIAVARWRRRCAARDPEPASISA
jgi:cytochrome c biogenesis protein CcdA